MGHQQRFKANLVSLSKYILGVNDEASKRGIKIIDSGILGVGAALVENIDCKVMIETFITKSHSSWEEIRKHNEPYFVEHACDFFAGIPEDAIKKMITLIMGRNEKGEYYVDKKVRDTIWKYMEAFVKIALKYLHPNGSGFMTADQYKFHFEVWEVKM